jgi:hypothetical protein
LQMIIAHWGDVPADKRRELFEAFAQRVFIHKMDMLHRQLVICWRDGTESLHDFTRAGRRVFWSPDELEKLKMLVESGAPQVEIMRAFPILAWKEIQKRYAYHFGNGGFAAYYDGEKKYPAHFTWNDTEVAQAEQSAQLSVSIPPLPVMVRCSVRPHNRSSILVAG